MPGNGLPGFDPNHIANVGLTGSAGKESVVSALSLGKQGNIINLLNAKVGTLTGTPTALMTPFGSGITAASTAKTQFTTQGTSSQITVAAIVYIAAAIAATSRMAAFGVSGNNTFGIDINGSNQFAWVINSGTSTGVGITPVVGHTYFVGLTARGTANSFYAVADLNTGQIQIPSVSATVVSSTWTTFTVANGPGGGSPLAGNAYVLAAMGNTNLLSQDALFAWAQDPWSFWYPRTEFGLSSFLTSVQQSVQVGQPQGRLFVPGKRFAPSGSPRPTFAYPSAVIAIQALFASGFTITRGLVSPSGVVPLQARGEEISTGKEQTTGVVSVQARGETISTGRNQPSGVVSLAVRQFTSSALTFLGSALTVALSAFGSVMAKALTQTSGKVPLQARGIEESTGRNQPSGVVPLQARGQEQSTGRTGITGSVSLAARAISIATARATGLFTASIAAFGRAMATARVAPTGIVPLKAFGNAQAAARAGFTGTLALFARGFTSSAATIVGFVPPPVQHVFEWILRARRRGRR